MKNVYLKMRITSLFLYGLLFGCSYAPTITTNLDHDNEYVVLLHGLARTEKSMRAMQEALEKSGYRTCNIGYPSTKYPIEILTNRYVKKKIRECLPPNVGKINFVTHSMGGIIVRQLLNQKEFHNNVDRVVMLSPPNQGSEVVDKMRGYWLFKLIHGPAGTELGTKKDNIPGQLGPADFTLGIITGSSTINPVLSSIIPGEDDGKVSVGRAKLSGMSDFMVVSVSHPFIMKDEEVISQTLYFLQHGVFRNDEGNTHDGARS